MGLAGKPKPCTIALSPRTKSEALKVYGLVRLHTLYSHGPEHSDLQFDLMLVVQDMNELYDSNIKGKQNCFFDIRSTNTTFFIDEHNLGSPWWVENNIRVATKRIWSTLFMYKFLPPQSLAYVQPNHLIYFLVTLVWLYDHEENYGPKFNTQHNTSYKIT
jgi:hypothetical protein